MPEASALNAPHATRGDGPRRRVPSIVQTQSQGRYSDALRLRNPEFFP